MSVNAVSGCGQLNGGESTDESATFTSVSFLKTVPHDSGSSLCFLVYVRMIHVDGGSSYVQQGV